MIPMAELLEYQTSKFMLIDLVLYLRGFTMAEQMAMKLDGLHIIPSKSN